MSAIAEGRELEAPVTGIYYPWLGVRGAQVCEREIVPEVRFAEEPGGTRPKRRPENVPCSPFTSRAQPGKRHMGPRRGLSL